MIVADVFNSDERAELEAYALERGFPSLRDYLWTLIHQDMKHDDERSDDDGGPPESFRRAWEEASNRRTMSWDEFLRRLGE